MSSRTFLVTEVSKGIGRALSECLALGPADHVVGLVRQGNGAAFPGELAHLTLRSVELEWRTDQFCAPAPRSVRHGRR